MIAETASFSLLDPWFLTLVPVIWGCFAWRLLRGRAALPIASVDLLEGLPKTLRTSMSLWELSRWFQGCLSCLASSRSTLRLQSQGLSEFPAE